jgi:hypothetical protein
MSYMRCEISNDKKEKKIEKMQNSWFVRIARLNFLVVAIIPGREYTFAALAMYRCSRHVIGCFGQTTFLTSHFMHTDPQRLCGLRLRLQFGLQPSQHSFLLRHTWRIIGITRHPVRVW